MAQDKSLNGYHRFKAAKKITPGDKQDNVLIALAQDQSLHAHYLHICIQAAEKIIPGDKRDNALLALAQDQRANQCWGSDRFIEAVLKLPPDDKRDNILLAMVKNRSWGVEDRKDIAGKISSSQIRTQAFSNIF